MKRLLCLLLAILGMVGMGWGQDAIGFVPRCPQDNVCLWQDPEGRWHLEDNAGDFLVDLKKLLAPSEPIDVPAIKGEPSDLKIIAADHAQCPAGYEADWNYNRDACLYSPDQSLCYAELMCYPLKQRWTCTDKSRILLTAEDGKHWCHKPQN
jgi:hypothetical protein